MSVTYNYLTFSVNSSGCQITIDMHNFTFSHDLDWTTIYFNAGKDKWVGGNTEGYVNKYCIATYGGSSDYNPIDVYVTIDSESDRKQFDLCFEQFVSDVKSSGQLICK